MKKIITTLIIALSTLNSSDFDYAFNYFGNFSTTGLSHDGFYAISLRPEEIGSDLSIKPLSKFGGQLSIFKDNFEFTAQKIVKYFSKGSIDWLYLKYNYNYNLSFKIGRMQVPFFLNSNSLEVDYIHTWTRAPIEVYGMIPMDSYNGVELSYQKDFDNFFFSGSVMLYGSREETLENMILINASDVNDSYFDIDKGRGVSLSFEKDNFTIKGTHYQGRTSVYLDNDKNLKQFYNVLDFLKTLGYDYSYVKNDYIWDKAKTTFSSFGINYDAEDFFVQSEIARMNTYVILPEMLGYYILTGYKYSYKFTPYFIFAQHKNNKEHFYENRLTSNNSDITPILDEVTTNINKQLYQLNFGQTTLSLGFRYDIEIGLSLKMQIDRIESKSYGVENDIDPFIRLGFLGREQGVTDKPVYLYSMSINFAY
jgi:hypothetical protein